MSTYLLFIHVDVFTVDIIIFSPMDHSSFGSSYHCPYFGVNGGNRGFYLLMAQHSAPDRKRRHRGIQAATGGESFLYVVTYFTQ